MRLHFFQLRLTRLARLDGRPGFSGGGEREVAIFQCPNSSRCHDFLPRIEHPKSKGQPPSSLDKCVCPCGLISFGPSKFVIKKTIPALHPCEFQETSTPKPKGAISVFGIKVQNLLAVVNLRESANPSDICCWLLLLCPSLSYPSSHTLKMKVLRNLVHHWSIRIAVKLTYDTVFKFDLKNIIKPN